MADIRRYPLIRHLRTEPVFHVMRYRNGKITAAGRGLNFFFFPMGAAVAEIPMDDRNLNILFHGRAKDHQEVTVQGAITYRVVDPEALANRVDFTLDLKRGVYLKDPLEQLAGLITGIAQQHGIQYLAMHRVEEILTAGFDPIQARINAGLVDDPKLTEMGIEIVVVQIQDVAPIAEVTKALQTPTREAVQQLADQAMFERRAMAVEKERAIQENELQNQIELAKREENLIEQRGQNGRRLAREEAEAKKIEAEAKAARGLVDAEAQAHRIELVEAARNNAERVRTEIYEGLPTEVMMGLAAQEFAGKLQNIEHLNITPELLGPMLTKLMDVGTRRLAVGTE